MNSNFYTPLAFANQVQMNQMTQRLYKQVPVLLIRTQEGVQAYEDYCPHRGLALSEGKFSNGQIVCKYHGWKFDAENGTNTDVPVKQQSIQCRLKKYFIQEKYDIIWISEEEHDIIPELFEHSANMLLSGSIIANTINVLENFLEGSHTHYVHNGLIRTGNKKRNQIQAKIHQTQHGFQVHYEHEPPKGFVTRILPKKWQQLKAVSTYLNPGVAILEYYSSDMQLVSRFEAILQEHENGVNYLARVYLKLGWLGQIIQPFAKIMFKKIIEQDKEILELQQKNLSRFKQNKFISDETDTVGKWIYAFQTKQVTNLNKEEIFNVHW